MAMYLWVIGIFIVLLAWQDGWFYAKMKQHGFYRWFRRLSLVPLFFFIAVLFFIRFGLRSIDNYLVAARLTWVFVAIALIYIPKTFYILFYYINRAYNRLFNKQTRLFRVIGFGFGAFFVSILLYGILVTRDNFYVKHQTVAVSGLPAGFDGFKIALIADFHLGNWNNRYRIMEPITEMINAQEVDILVFAGDMINNYAAETEGWEPYFARLKCKSGVKLAVLGNHDYGDYTHWETPEDKRLNLEETKQNIRKLGFRLLLNEHTEIEHRGDTLTVVGVENFGSGHFHNYSNLPQALAGSRSDRMKMLITHDPNHWRAEVAEHHPDIFLTLAGHTHAAQLGFVRRWLKISPAALIYPLWDGLYARANQFLYVNRGIGYVGMPIRIGVPPEITVIELKRKE